MDSSRQRTREPGRSDWLTGISFDMHDGDGVPFQFDCAGMRDTTTVLHGYRYDSIPPAPTPTPGPTSEGEMVIMAAADDAELAGASEGPVELTQDKVRARVKMQPELSGMSFLESAMPTPIHVYLRLEGITGRGIPQDYRVMIDLEGDTEPPLPVGLLTTFGVANASNPDEPHGGAGLTQIYDITKAAERLKLTTESAPLVQVTFEKVPGGAVPSPRRMALRISRTNLKKTRTCRSNASGSISVEQGPSSANQPRHFGTGCDHIDAVGSFLGCAADDVSLGHLSGFVPFPRGGHISQFSSSSRSAAALDFPHLAGAGMDIDGPGDDGSALCPCAKRSLSFQLSHQTVRKCYLRNLRFCGFRVACRGHCNPTDLSAQDGHRAWSRYPWPNSVVWLGVSMARDPHSYSDRCALPSASLSIDRKECRLLRLKAGCIL